MSPVKFAILLIAEGPWRRLNSNQMCFGAGDNQSGGFVVEVNGLIDAVKLVHLYGQVSCDVPNGRWSSCGCAGTKLRVFLTNSTDDILVPKVEWGSDRYKCIVQILLYMFIFYNTGKVWIVVNAVSE